MRVQRLYKPIQGRGGKMSGIPPKSQGCSPGRAGDALWGDAGMVLLGELELLPGGSKGCSPERVRDALWGVHRDALPG